MGKYYVWEEKEEKIMATSWAGSNTGNTGLIFSNGNWVPIPLDTAIICTNAVMILQQWQNEDTGKCWVHKALLISLETWSEYKYH